MTKKQTDEQPNSLVPVPPSELSTGEKYIPDDCLDHGDLYVPTMQLLQGMSDPVKQGLPGARPGLFWDPYRQEAIAGPIEAVVGFFTKARFMRAGGRGEHEREQCQSFDNVTGTRYGNCETCVYRMWPRDTDTPVDWDAPPCSLNYTFILQSPNGPMALRFRKKAEKAARTFLTQKTMAQKNWWHHPVRIDAKQETGVDDSGKPAQYYVPTIAWILDKEKETDPALRAYMKAMHDGLRAAQEAGRFRTDDAESGVD